MEVEILDTSVQRILLSWTGIIICNGIKDIANQVLWSCALCRGKKKKNPVITWDLFCTLPKCKTSQLAFLPMQNGCSSPSNYMGIGVLPPGLYFSINISSDIFQNSMYWFPRLFFFFFSIDRTTLVNREPIDLWALATSWVKMYFYWFKRILSFKKSKKGNLGNRPDYNNRNDNYS